MRRQLSEERESLSSQFRGWRAYSAYSKVEVDKVKKKHGNVAEDCGLTGRRRASDEEGALTRAIESVSAYRKRWLILRDADARWADISVAFQAEADSLRRSGAAIPGKAFAKEVDALHRGVGLTLKEIPNLKQSGQVDSRFGQVQQQLSRLDGLIKEAVEAINGQPALEAEINQISELGVEQDVECAQSFQTLLRIQEDIRAGLRANSYVSANRMLHGAMALCRAVRHNIETRHDLARVEINLWLDDEEIVRRFDLNSFGVHLSPAEAQRWTDCRVEIRAVIAERAERTRRAFASLSPAHRNLKIPLSETKDWAKLGAFARSAVKYSTYERPSAS